MRENAWDLDERLARHCNKICTKLICTEKLKENILDVHPVLSNVLKRLKMDDFLLKLMPGNPIRGEGGRQVKRGKGLEEIWDCINRTIGPLSPLWGTIEEKLESLEEPGNFPEEEEDDDPPEN